MNMMPVIEDSKDDTRFNPSCTPWRVRPDDAGSRVGTIYNDAGRPIAAITANSAKQLVEIANLIEDSMRKVEQLESELAEITRREHANVRRKSWFQGGR